MAMSLDQLTDNQAQHALLYFFQELPPRLWPGEKPKFSDIEVISEEVTDEAKGDQKALLESIQSSNPALRGELSKAILKHLETHPDYEPFVEGAVHYCTQPRMAPVSFIIAGTVIISLAILKIPKKGAVKITKDTQGNVISEEHGASANDIEYLGSILEGASKVLAEIPGISSLF